VKNQKYIIRCDRAGVFYGEIKERRGSEADLVNARCLWHWAGAASLLQLATEGTKAPHSCQFTVTVPSMTVLGVIEVIPCNKEAIKNIDGVPEWKV
jgi:hypothetical protein